MPYIKKEMRQQSKDAPKAAGELAFAIANIYTKVKGKRFSDRSRVVGEVGVVIALVESCIKSSRCNGDRLKTDIKDLFLNRPEVFNFNDNVRFMFELIVEYLKEPGVELFDVLGSLKSVSMEYYRRALGPYEDKACETNGDVFRF